MHHTRSRSIQAGITCVAVALALSACGGDGSGSSSSSAPKSSTTAEAKTPGAAELYNKARSTALAAESAHIKGSMTDAGQTMTLDLAGATDGSNQSLVVTVTGDAKATILTVDKKYYMTGNDAFWTSQGGAAVAKMFAGKYVLVPAEQAKEMGDITLQSLLTQMFDDKDMSALKGLTANVTKSTVDGVPAYTLTDKVGKDNGQIVVTADGTATLIKIVGPKAQPGELAFSDWNKVPPVVAPPAAKVVQMPK